MTTIEDELRAAFTARTGALPVMDDPAGTAIRQARAIRRRRGIVGTTAAVLVVLAAAGAALRYASGSPPERATTEMQAEAPPQVAVDNTMDRRVGQELWTADGHRYALSEVGHVSWVHRVPAGWLYAGDTGGVRLLLSDRSSLALDIDGTDVVVSPDGARIAWLKAQTGAPFVRLSAGTLTENGVVQVVGADAPQGAEPVGFAGPRVLLRQPVDAKRYRFDFWTIGHTFSPTWVDNVSALYGEYGSNGVVGRVPVAGEECLALFDADAKGLHPGQQKCGLGLTAGTEGALSPAGRWLAVRTASTLRVIDLRAAFGDQPGKVVTCTAAAATGPPIWIDNKHVVATTDRGWAVCTTTGLGVAVDDPVLAQLAWVPVPANR
jgi:hypothetical protein